MAINFSGLSSANTDTRSKVSDSSTTSAQQSVADKQPAITATDHQTATVKLSSEAQLLNKLEEQLTQLPDADEGRIATIKQAIANGTFSVNQEQIAAKLTSLEEQLFD
ncbi:MAG: negative regulator of flagellin synthesis FlgM [Motiliproteus sp.]|jgi:negative regulator of flagellin synthesis FlgM